MFKAILLAIIAIAVVARGHRRHHQHNHLPFHIMDRPIFDLRPRHRNIFDLPNIFMNQHKVMSSFDSMFNAIQKQMEEEMQLPTISVRKVVIEQTPVPAPVEVIVPEKVNGDMARCLQLLQQIMVEANQIIDEAKNKEWSKVLPQIVDLIQKTIEDIECFKNSTANEALDTIMASYTQLVGDRRECVVSHLKDACELFREAFNFLLSLNVNDAINSFNKAVTVLKDTANC